MTRYAIKRIDTGEILPEPYRYDSQSEAILGLEELKNYLSYHEELGIEIPYLRVCQIRERG